MIIPFDILYEGFCNRVRSSGKSDTILSLIKKENNDCFRIKALLTEEPDLCSLLERNISESYERKDELLARKLWERALEGKSPELITEALSYCPIPNSFEEKVVPAFEATKVKSLLESFMGSPMKEYQSPENNDIEQLMFTILYDRGCILFNKKRFKSALKDILRAWILGYPKTLELAYQVAVCYSEFGELELSKELLQCVAQHLRTLSMSNEEKSVWTMNIVKVLKVVEGKKKGKKSDGKSIHNLLSSSQMTDSNIVTFSGLFSKESEHIKSTSDALELKYSQEKGRHMIAKQNIAAGSTIIAENPFAWTISKPNYHKFCTWCLQRIDTGIPCQTCASAIFCDSTCRQLAMTSFHGKECKILKLLDSSQKLGNMALLCFRTILTTPLTTVEEFTKLIQTDSPPLPHKITMGLDDEEQFDSAKYLSVFSQTPNSEQRQAADLLKRTFSAIYLTLCLKYVEYTNKDLSESILNGMSTKEVDIAALILRHLQSASCNAYGINYIEKKANYAEGDEKNLQIDEIGGATYPIISTTNHSCSPNSYRINVPGKVCLVKTLRDIQEGDEIYDCYGPLYLMEARQERIGKLQSQYLFRCGCPPCTENWPTFGKLRQHPLQYKCSSCQCALKVDAKNISNKLKCPYCDKVTDMKKLRENLAVHKERFDLAKTSILAEVFQPFDTDMEKILCEFIGACQASLMEPNFDIVEGQEILKVFWNISIRNS